MRITDLYEASVETWDDLHLTPEQVAEIYRYVKSPKTAAMYLDGWDYDLALRMMKSDHRSGMRRRAREKAEDKLIAALDGLRDTARPISYRSACALIASDDDLFDFIVAWTENADYAEDAYPKQAKRFLSVLTRINPPVRKHLFRGQQSFGEAHAHTRGFHSWSANRSTAEIFAERSGRIIEIDRPIQGVALSDIVDWRMRLRPGESHYAGPQAEWFVVDQPEQVEG